MSRHSNQFQMYADAVKNELEMAYEQGRKDEREKIIIELEDVTTSAYLASDLYNYIKQLKTYEDKIREEVIEEAIDDFVDALEKLNKKRKGIGIDIIDVFEIEKKLKEQNNGKSNDM